MTYELITYEADRNIEKGDTVQAVVHIFKNSSYDPIVEINVYNKDQSLNYILNVNKEIFYPKVFTFSFIDEYTYPKEIKEYANYLKLKLVISNES